MPRLDPSSPIFTFGVLLAKATLLLGAAFIGATLLQRAAAGARHLLWVAIIGALLLLPALSAWSPLRLAILPSAPAASVAPDASAPPTSPAIDESTERRELPTLPAIPAGDVSLGDASVTATRAFTPWQIALMIWGVVALALGAWLAASFVLVRRIVDRATPLVDKGWTAPLYEIADRLGLQESPRIVRSDEVMMPFAAGVLHPTIVLPAGSDAWDDERRSAVLMHELAHIRRRDLLGHTLGRVACALYWFHPLVWSAARRLRIESERACDDLALTCGLRATSYAEHLLDIVSGIRQPRTPILAIPMADRKEFEGRMLAILDPEVRRRPGRLQSLSLVGGLAALVLVVGAAVPVERAQELASRDRGLAGAGVASPENASTVSPPSPSDDREDAAMHEVDLTQDGRAKASARAEAKANARAEARAEVRTEMRVDTRTDLRVDVQTNLANEALAQRLRIPVERAFASLGRAGVDTLDARSSDQRATLLVQVLRADTSAELRRVAAWGLQDYANRRDVAEALGTALRQDKSAAVREYAAWALADAEGSQPAITALVAALRGDGDDKVRETAAWALGSIEAESARDDLVKALESDRSAAVRGKVLWALGNAGEGKAPPAVLAALADSSRQVRRLAAWTLFNMEDASAVPALERALSNESDKELRNAYIRALGAIGGESAGALARLLDSKDAELRAAVVNALAGRNASPWPMPMPRPRPFP